jgi:hypothetical protein
MFMEKSELYLLFKTLSISELNELEIFIQNDFLVKGRYRSQARHLLLLLKEHMLVEKKSALEKEFVFQRLFPDQSVSVGQLERVMHELLQIIKNFLLCRDFFSEANEANRQVRFGGILRSRGLENKAMALANQLIKQLEDLKVKGKKYYEIKFEASLMLYSMNSQNTKWKDDLQIPTVVANLDFFYHSVKLMLVNHYLLLNNVPKIGDLVGRLPQNMQITINPEYLRSEPYILVAYKIYELFSQDTPNKEGFDELLDLLNQYEEEMDAESLTMSYGFLRNYCTILIRAGHFELNVSLFSIMVDNLNKGYLYFQGKFSLGAYYNIANVALRVDAFEWAYRFAQEYKNLTFGTPEEKEETWSLIMAHYHYRKKEFDLAITLLPQNSQNLQFLLTIKTLEVMIYYDQGSELFFYKLDAFKMFINRSGKKNISGESSERHTNFINLMAQIANSAKGDIDRANKIIGRIKAKDNVLEKEWLLKKAEEIKYR